MDTGGEDKEDTPQFMTSADSHAAPAPWLKVLRRKFGHRAFRAGQLDVVRILLEGRSALAVFPTGGGKSVCYQLPALLLPGGTVVVTPLIALMRDQVDELQRRGIPAARLDSTLLPAEEEQVLRDWREGNLKLLYLSPERLAIESSRQLLRERSPDLMAIDEAHCISEWGHHFRPDYLKLARFQDMLGIPRVVTLTATATTRVADDIRREFGIAETDEIRLGFHRRNLDLRIEPCRPRFRLRRLRRELVKVLERPGCAIVYVTRQETAAMVASQLAANDIPARAYHAGLPTDLRAETQAAFMEGKLRVIVATIAFGMGIDKADIRLVVHFNMPKSLEGYSQEVGRAGRDGRKAKALWLACPGDITVLENFIFGDTPTRRSVDNLVDHVLRSGPEFDLSIRDLSIACDMREAVARTLLTYLELDDIIEVGERNHAAYRIRLLRPLRHVLAGHSPDETELLEGLFSCADDVGRGWLEMVPAVVATRLSRSEAEIRSAVGWLADGDEVVVHARRLQWRFRRRIEVTAKQIHSLSEKLWRHSVEREQRELERLEQVWQLALTSDCLTATIARHFGEDMTMSCGHCDRCRKTRVAVPEQRRLPEPDTGQIEAVRQLVAEGNPHLRKARQLARFLCGLNSPAIERNGLRRDPRFGLMADVPFAAVNQLCEALIS